MFKKRAIIVGGGTCNRHLLASIYKTTPFQLIIAVDGGLHCFEDEYFSPTMIVGDFDSVHSDLLAHYQDTSNRPEIIKLNPVKDMSDTQAAVDIAIERGVTEVVLLGVTGTRIDHMYANLQLLVRMERNSVKGVIVDTHNRIRVITKSFRIKRSEQYGKYVSFLPFNGPVTGVSLQGVKYPLTDYTMPVGDSIGVSNEISGEEAVINIASGILLMIESRD